MGDIDTWRYGRTVGVRGEGLKNVRLRIGLGSGLGLVVGMGVGVGGAGGCWKGGMSGAPNY